MRIISFFFCLFFFFVSFPVFAESTDTPSTHSQTQKEAASSEKPLPQAYPRYGFALYLTPKLGYSSPFIDARNTTKFTSVAHFGLAFGTMYRFESPFALRLELEYLYRTKSKTNFPVPNSARDSLETLLQTLLANAYIDWYITPECSLYLTGGAGVSMLAIDNAYNKQVYSNEFAWQAGIGFTYALTKHITFDFGLRYTSMLSVGLKATPNVKLNNISALETTVGIRYAF